MQRIKHWYDVLTQPVEHMLSLADIEELLAKQGMALTITRKRVKNINFRVKPNQLCVSVPKRVSQKTLVAAIQARVSWAIKANEQLLAKQERQPDVNTMALATGSEVKLWGETYQLVVETSRKKIQATADKATKALTISVKAYETEPESLQKQLQSALTELYRTELTEIMPALFEKWQPVVGKYAHETRTKKMTTRWGSCNVKDKRVWLSVYLAQYPVACTEYVIVHELCHLHEPNHSKRFWAQVQRAMPDYKHWHDYLKGTGRLVD